jgi:uncharacterized membrane protein YkvI
MDKIKKVVRIINWIIFFYLIGITLLVILGALSYGRGLEDLFYILGTFASALVHLMILLSYIYQKDKSTERDTALLISILFLLVSVSFTYQFTLGRGPEWKWDGNVFCRKTKIQEEVQALTLASNYSAYQHTPI